MLGIAALLCGAVQASMAADRVVVVPLLGGVKIEGDAQERDVIEGRTFSSVHGDNLVGAMPDCGSSNYMPGPLTQYVAYGYHNGTGRIWGDANLVATNIRDGKSIFGVAGDFSRDANATAADLPLGVSAYVKGARVEGAAPLGSDVVGPPGAWFFTIPDGYYRGNRIAMLNLAGSGLVPENIRHGSTVFGVAGSFTLLQTPDSPAGAAQVLAGKSFFVNGVQVVGTVPAGQSFEGADGQRSIPIPDGLYSGGDKTATAVDSDLAPENLRNGIDILGIVGTMTGLRKTGQQLCYNALAVETNCAGTGQDGEYQLGMDASPRFHVNGDNTVTDNLTGLMWLRDTTCIWGTKRTWYQALGYVQEFNQAGINSCNTAGHADWRLPNLFELESLRDMSRDNPALPRDTVQWPGAGHPFVDMQNDRYWTSTTYANGKTKAWVVNFIDGATQAMEKGPDNAYAWYVRGGR